MTVNKKYLLSILGAVSAALIFFVVLAVLVPNKGSDLMLPPLRCIIGEKDSGCKYVVPETIDMNDPGYIYEASDS